MNGVCLSYQTLSESNEKQKISCYDVLKLYNDKKVNINTKI